MATDFFSSTVGANSGANTSMFGFGTTPASTPTPTPAYANPYMYGNGFPMGGIPTMETAPALYTAEDEALLRQASKCDYQLTKADIAKLNCDHRERVSRQLLVIRHPTTQQCECTQCGSKFFVPTSTETKETDSLQDIWNKFNCAKILNPGIVPIPIMQTVATSVGIIMKTLPVITETIMKSFNKSYNDLYAATNAAINNSGYYNGYDPAASVEASRMRSYNPQFAGYYAAPQQPYAYTGVQVPPYYAAPQQPYAQQAMPQMAPNIPNSVPGPVPNMNVYQQPQQQYGMPQAGAFQNPFGTNGVVQPQQPYAPQQTMPQMTQPGIPNAFAVPGIPAPAVPMYQAPATPVDPNAAAVAANPAIPTPAAMPAPATPAAPTPAADVNAGTIKP